ncbi:MAG: glycosyl hydrolase family 28-related protein [Armatimonadia bacterium]
MSSAALPSLSCLFLSLLGAVALAAPSPTILWASDPVRPDETVVIFGGGFEAGSQVEGLRLPDSPCGAPTADAELPAGDWQRLEVLQADARCVKAVIPADWRPGVFAVRVRVGEAVSRPALANRPDPWWVQGDQGFGASSGGWLRVFGKCLAFDAPATVVLIDSKGVQVTLQPTRADCYSLNLALPSSLPPTDYTVWVHNGLGGPASWRSAGKLTVTLPKPWREQVYNVKDFGANSDQAIRAALVRATEEGGGVVYFPRGRYKVEGALDLPDGITLRGEGMGLVSLYWPDMEEPPPALITGSHFRLQNLSLYCQNHRNVIADTDAAEGIRIESVRIRANCYFMIEDIGKEFRGRKGPTSHKTCGAAVMLRGRNFAVTDCDLYASNYALRLFRSQGGGLVARNVLRYGGRGYSLERVDRMIFEDNQVIGCNLLSIGNDITTFWTNYSRNLYYAHNRLSQMYGADREMMTLDAGGGAYFGKVAQTQGKQVVLAADPTYKDYAPKPHTDWTGAMLLILDGTGTGQWRTVVKNEGRNWEIDRPWDIAPDDTSLISIVPHRGRHLFIGNSFEDGGPFQLYGSAVDTIVAGNRGTRMDGFITWGLNPHQWGWQPAWYCQFLDNEIVEGNGYGPRSAFMGSITGNNDATYPGPLSRCALFRRNVLQSNARLRLSGTTRDALIEHCTVRHADQGIEIQPSTGGVLLRGNVFEDVTTPLAGDGVAAAKVVP